MKKSEVNFHEFEWHTNRKFQVYVVPGNSIEIHARNGENITHVNVFRIGDPAEHDSYNLKYVGIIKGITAKNVIIEPRMGNKKRHLDFRAFAWRNFDFDADKVAKENWETISYI